MKAKEVRELSVNELETKLKDLKAELFNLRFQHATNQLDNPLRLAADSVVQDFSRSQRCKLSLDVVCPAFG